MQSYEVEVFGNDEMIDSFNRHKNSYMRKREVKLAENFVISDSAVKKQERRLLLIDLPLAVGDHFLFPDTADPRFKSFSDQTAKNTYILHIVAFVISPDAVTFDQDFLVSDI